MIRQMSLSLAFDVYGTLIDPMGITDALRPSLGADAASFAARWREKQLEYLFRRGLGDCYESFSVCTEQALDFTCEADGRTLPASARDAVLAAYATLPAFPDAKAALATLQKAGFRCYAFSNGEPASLALLLERAGLRGLLQGIVSVADVGSYKPDPAVYSHFLREAGARPYETWLVSGKPFRRDRRAARGLAGRVGASQPGGHV